MFPDGSTLTTLMAVGNRPPRAKLHLDELDHKALQLAGDILQVTATASRFVFARHCLVGQFDQSLMTPGCCPGQPHLHKVDVYLCKFRCGQRSANSSPFCFLFQSRQQCQSQTTPNSVRHPSAGVLVQGLCFCSFSTWAKREICCHFSCSTNFKSVYFF